jgi:protein O-GlcNAc transferase|eukprot:SAG25_NODE_14303_length_256_cov_1.286624_1_plen_65_part_00
MDEALACARTAISSNPHFAEAHNNMGVAFRDMGSIVESIECYDRCLQLCPTGRNAAQNRLLVGY